MPSENAYETWADVRELDEPTPDPEPTEQYQQEEDERQEALHSAEVHGGAPCTCPPVEEVTHFGPSPF